MPLTEKQIKLLNDLSDTEWVPFHLLRNSSKATVTALCKNKKILAVTLQKPTSITDEDVEAGKIYINIRPFNNNDYWPDFIKRIDNSYSSYEENKVFLLEKKVIELENQINLLIRNKLKSNGKIK